jgi:protein-S-isoprenylcysteine O-methyltransferase Ste14
MVTMDSSPDPLYRPVFWAVMVCWFGFAAAFILRKRPKKETQQARNRKSVPGIALMGLGMALAWFVRRPIDTALVSLTPMLIAALDVVCVACAAGSAWLVLTSVRTLGKQWSVQAALVKEHQLVTTGPYRVVRHPIYLGMIGLMVSTGMAISRWEALLVAIVFGVAGAIMRIRTEDELLRGMFGKDHDDYRNRVPALFPWIH